MWFSCILFTGSVSTSTELTVSLTGSSTMTTMTYALVNITTTRSQRVSLNKAAADIPYNFLSHEIRIAIYSVVGGVLVVGLTTLTGCLLCKRNVPRLCCGRYLRHLI